MRRTMLFAIVVGVFSVSVAGANLIQYAIHFLPTQGPLPSTANLSGTSSIKPFHHRIGRSRACGETSRLNVGTTLTVI
jgi:hypothetical protein